LTIEETDESIAACDGDCGYGRIVATPSIVPQKALMRRLSNIPLKMRHFSWNRQRFSLPARDLLYLTAEGGAVSMKLALTVWEGRISPLFDSAHMLLIADIKTAK